SYNIITESPPSRPLPTVTPKHLLKAWTTLRLPDPFGRWQIGGSLHAQTQTTNTALTCPASFDCPLIRAVQRAYAVFDLRAGFDVDRHWRVGLSVNNVLDEVYYETIGGGWYGEPRSWMLRIDGRY